MVETMQTNGIGRPRVEIAPEIVLNAFELNNRSIRGTARALGISSGLCFHRLKEMGAVPLGTGKGGKLPLRARNGKGTDPSENLRQGKTRDVMVIVRS